MTLSAVARRRTGGGRLWAASRGESRPGRSLPPDTEITDYAMLVSGPCAGAGRDSGRGRSRRRAGPGAVGPGATRPAGGRRRRSRVTVPVLSTERRRRRPPRPAGGGGGLSEPDDQRSDWLSGSRPARRAPGDPGSLRPGWPGVTAGPVRSDAGSPSVSQHEPPGL